MRNVQTGVDDSFKQTDGKIFVLKLPENYQSSITEVRQMTLDNYKPIKD